MGSMASQITSVTIVYSVYSGADERKHQSSASLAVVLGIHRGPVNSPHKWPVTRKMFPFDDVIMYVWIWMNNYITHKCMRYDYLILACLYINYDNERISKFGKILTLCHSRCIKSIPNGSKQLLSAHDFLHILSPCVNSLAPGRCGCNFKNIIFQLVSWTDTLSATSKIIVRWMPQNSTDEKSTLLQCWPRSLSPYGVTRPQWVKLALAYFTDIEAITWFLQMPLDNHSNILI